MTRAMSSFSKVRQKKIYEVVVDQIKERIASGQLKAGDMLPTEKTLCEAMGVSRASMREATRILEYLGFIESRAGEGTRVAHFHPDLLLEKLNNANLPRGPGLLLELMELRELLEPRAASLAAVRATDAELRLLASIVEQGAAADVVESSKADAKYHLAIARASHNVFYARIVESVLSLLEEVRRHNMKLSRRREEIVREHTEVVACVCARDAEKAAVAMRTHLENVRALVERCREDEGEMDEMIRSIYARD